MISAVDITLQFGDRVLFDHVSFHIGRRDRIGLVGANGTGKSTLMKILAGEAASEGGSFTRAKHCTVGLLPQEGITLGAKSLFDEVEAVFADALETERRIVEVGEQLSQQTEGTEEHAFALHLYGELQHRLELSDAYRRKAEIEQVLSGLGFGPGDASRATSEFSGGWQMRIALAKLLLEKPALLLLDEPTNHLDLDSLQWLEEYIETYRGAVVLVSHDRRFLDTRTTTTFELSDGRLTAYAGNYSFYVRSREERLQQLEAAGENQQQYIKQTERFIARFRYKATKARQVQSRIKVLAKLDRIETGEDEKSIRFAFPVCRKPGRAILQLESATKMYGANVVFRNLEIDIERGDRAVFVGVNGAGKSTLARMLAGVESLSSGKRLVGHNVLISYFAQHQAEELDPTKTALETVYEVAGGDVRPRLRDILGSFLFRGEDVHKKVAVLSGGEKSRLALARMLMRPANFLVLDEPTNHLDMRSKSVLQQALGSFDGSYVIVSHDRDFVDQLVNRVVDVRHGGIRTYMGNLSDFTEKKRLEQEGNVSDGSRGEVAVSFERARKRQEAKQRQQRYEKMRPLQDRIAGIERAIEEKEKRKQECERMMGDPDFYRLVDRVKKLTAEYRVLERSLKEDYATWNELNTELEDLL
ncbi:MAG: ABC-F family ATP-binding cassette domain-containing protein [Bacteroidetes bacterium]|nr:ABC-F family ATP-binding cassette domain-containing protein [Bacteroidota bacterium]